MEDRQDRGQAVGETERVRGGRQEFWDTGRKGDTKDRRQVVGRQEEWETDRVRDRQSDAGRKGDRQPGRQARQETGRVRDGQGGRPAV
jgi:hypothetical protein